ncbi:MAG TPA: hypothetical protein ENJ95_10465 [Bacteroidetes bacterium]|nr:hypothetical protein [Bacteroidota bacterium]
MVLQIPDKISTQLNLTEKELLIELSILFYRKHILSLKTAAELSNMPVEQFRKMLALRGGQFEDENRSKKSLREEQKEELLKRNGIIQQFKGKARHPEFEMSKYDVYEQ